MGLIYFLSFFTLIAAVILVWAIIKLLHSQDNSVISNT